MRQGRIVQKLRRAASLVNSLLSIICTLEADYIRMTYPVFNSTILAASNFSVLHIAITSALRPNSTRICDALSSRVPETDTPTRWLLQSTIHQVSITFVAMAQELYVLVLDWLLWEGLSGVSIVTARAAAKICD